MKDVLATLPEYRGVIVGLGLILVTAFIISVIFQQVVVTNKSKHTRGVIHRNDMKKIKTRAKVLFFVSAIVLYLGLGTFYIKAGLTIADKADQAQEAILSRLLQDDKVNVDEVN